MVRGQDSLVVIGRVTPCPEVLGEDFNVQQSSCAQDEALPLCLSIKATIIAPRRTHFLCSFVLPGARVRGERGVAI